jgi:hypothetical protein
MSGNTLLENTSFSGKKDDALLLAALLGVTIFFRLYLLQMINVGPDEIDYWFSAKQLVTGGVYPEIMHRTIRWSIILPVAFFQLLFGFHPVVYYVTPVLNSFIQTVLLYYFGKKLFGRGVAFYAVLLFTSWPYMWRTGSQIRPAIFSLTYVLISIFALFVFLQTDHRRYLIISVIFLFLAYQSKITNLYFIPGILILLWRHKRKLIEPLKYGSFLLGLYLIEHMAYWIFTGNKMGRLGIIAAYHMSGDFADKLPGGFLGLFARYTEYMELPWKLIFLVFIASTIYLLIKKKRWAFELTILHASFFFFLTFMVKSIHPVEPVEPFLDRYYIVNLPTMSLIIVYALKSLIPEKIVNFFFQQKTAQITAIALTGMILTVTALPMPQSASRFFTPLSNIASNPIPKSFALTTIMEQALEENLPIISIDTNKPLDTVNRVFYNYGITGRKPIRIESTLFKGHTVYYLKNVGTSLDLYDPKQLVLFCDRFNFDMNIIPLMEIPALSDVYSSDL